MSADFRQEFVTSMSDPAQAGQTLDKLAAVAQASAVFSQPVEAAGYTVITAAEVTLGAGFAYGLGVGGSQAGGAAGDQPAGEGGGGGGGGGGNALARPVAVISVGPDGVRVEPIVDVTKIGLAFFAAVASMFLIGRGRRRRSVQ